MNNNINVKKNRPTVVIPLDSFTFNQGKFCMSYDFDIKPLVNSIKKVGIINKPFITSCNGGGMEIVTGYRRILALKELNLREVSCFDLSGSGKTDLDMLIMNIHDNLLNRKLNNIEKSMALNRLMDYSGDKRINREFMSLLEIKDRELEPILKIESLPDSLKHSIASDSISLKALETALGFNNEKECLACLEWINKLKLNFNQQLQFIDHITEIARRDKSTINRVLMGADFNDINEDENMNNPQKARKLLNILREKLFPDLTEYEREFNRRVKKLRLPGNIKISHPRYFESEGYRLEVEFRDGIDLKASIDHLGSVKGLENVGDPWEKDK